MDTLPALDGRRLAATWFVPDRPRAAVVVNSALGVKRGYYARFAEHLAASGLAVVTYDYRGVGDSVAGSIRRERATLLDWARLDVGGAIEAARTLGLPTWGVGHSFGGQAFGMSNRAVQLAGAVAVAACVGDLRVYPRRLALKYGVPMRLAPVVGRVFGYIPRPFGLGADLPAGVVTQWARFCHTRGYVRGAVPASELYYGELRFPMLFVEVADDTYAPRAPAAVLRGWYAAATVTHRVYTPAELGVDTIGHFGIFRRGATERIWADIAAFILRS